jgi:hypothetical protein
MTGKAKKAPLAEERGKADVPRLIERERRDYAELRALVDKFQAATGIPLVSEELWCKADVAAIARAYRLGVALEGKHGRDDLSWLRNALDGTAKALDNVRASAAELLDAAKAAEEGP